MLHPFRVSLSLLSILIAGSVLAADTMPSAPSVRFEDVTQQAGLSGIGNGLCAWGDYDADGWIDLQIGDSLYHNNRHGGFDKLPIKLPARGIWADFDNDGHLDFFSAVNGRLYHGHGDGTFTPDHPLYDPAKARNPMAAAADANGDGRLDLYITNYENPVTPDWFFRALPGGGFAAPVNLLGKKGWAARGAVWGDFDDDGDQDLYVSNYRLMPNQLWVNDGHAHFQDQAKQRGVIGTYKPKYGIEPGNDTHDPYPYYGHTIGSYWGDFNNDSHLDILVVNFSHPPKYQDHVQVLINSGPPGYTFTNVNTKEAAGIYWQESYAKGALGDYDNDGNLDAYLTTVYTYHGDRGELFHNDGHAHFTPVGKELGVRVPDTYQLIWIDYDNDGMLDLLVGGRLFHNLGNTNHWIEVRVVGDEGSNRSAIGARVTVMAGGRTQIREVTAGQCGNQPPMVVHFGLGDATSPVTVRVRFPTGRVGQWHIKPNTIFIAKESQAKVPSSKR